ncbi:MAG: glucose-6-phosphate dehydrogenase [Candidatus Dormibacteraeota bacterium]|nr:glucose-6-phosphate dehydrogenase [Candidatus Dormibacteraeota bacterium]
MRAHTRRDVGESDALVFFGATGDLAHKKIFPALYAMAKAGRLKVPVIGVAYSHATLEDLRERAKDGIAKAPGGVDNKKAFDVLMHRLQYIDGDYEDPDTFARLREALGEAKRPTHYLAIPPVLFEAVIRSLAASGAAKDARVVVEKPFGRDLASARELNDVLRSVFPEQSIFRIDHFLGKEAIENITYFRFANSFLEPIWNRNHIALVQVTMAESFGVQGRGAFYETTGCLRDVVENHLFQIVSLLAMESPIRRAYDSQRDEKARIMKAIRPLTSDDLVRGQFDGYRQEPGVAPDSDVETYAAVRLHIDTWRWEGVPFYLRSGKNLATTVTEVLIQFRPPTLRVFADAHPAVGHGNYLRLRFAPDKSIAVGARVKRPGEEFVGRQRELFLSQDDPHEEPEYMRLLGDALDGDGMLFTREDSVEAAWEAVDGVLKHHQPCHMYKPGTWGPEEAENLIARHGGWVTPGPKPAE